MLRKKDINTSSAPSFFMTNTKKYSNGCNDNDKRKPILKKNSIKHNVD
jgi:hypothetical protein